MILTIEDGFIWDEEGNMIAVLTDKATKLHTNQIELGQEAIPALQNFVARVNTGKLLPKTTVREFEELLRKYKP